MMAKAKAPVAGRFSSLSVLSFSRNIGGVWVRYFSGTGVAGKGKGKGIAEGPDASGDGEGEKRLRRWRTGDPKAGFFLVLFIRNVIYGLICKLQHARKMVGWLGEC